MVLVIELGRIDTRTDRAATTDALTGLRNRLSFHADLARELSRASRESSQVVLFLIDIDDFKAINDDSGHATGDAVLVEIGKRLRRLVRGHDLLARMGGDEFVIVLVGVEQATYADAAARRIVEALNQPLVLHGRTTPVSASVGLAVFPLHAQDPDDLLRYADRAMYAAKQAGGRQYRVYEDASL